MKIGNHLEPLDDDSIVLRFVISQNQFDHIDANAFTLSTAEKEHDPSRISVWENSITPLQLAKQFVTNPKRDLVIELNVGDIRALGDDANHEPFGLDVKWDYLEDCLDITSNKLLPNATEGYEGHAGIFGLNPKEKLLRKKIRDKLTELANRSMFYKV